MEASRADVRAEDEGVRGRREARSKRARAHARTEAQTDSRPARLRLRLALSESPMTSLILAWATIPRAAEDAVPALVAPLRAVPLAWAVGLGASPGLGQTQRRRA